MLSTAGEVSDELISDFLLLTPTHELTGVS